MIELINNLLFMIMVLIGIVAFSVMLKSAVESSRRTKHQDDEMDKIIEEMKEDRRQMRRRYGEEDT